MAWLTESLGGPVLAWEIKRATRQELWRYFQLGYCAWLMLQAVAFFWAERSVSSVVPNEPQSHLDVYRMNRLHQMDFLGNYLAFLLQFQLVLIIALIPAFTAGSLGKEKERGTLFALFGTELTSGQILLGKLLSRLIRIVPLVLTPLPVLVVLNTLTGRGLTILILALAQEAILAFTLGAVSLLFAIWIRGAADAIIASYLFLGLAGLLIRESTTALPHAVWIDPVESLRKLFDGGSQGPFVAHLIMGTLLGTIGLGLGCRRLRTVCLEQRDRKPSRRLWAFRPAVGNDPIRWRECHVIGLAPLPILRLVPRWLALLAVSLFSAAVAGAIAHSLAPGFFPALLKIELIPAVEELCTKADGIRDCVQFMGLFFILWATLLVGVRCGTSVAEEKRRNTWDDLLLTAQSFREITTGKMWGVLQATVPYIIAYALPVFLFASAGGPSALVTAGMWFVFPCATVFVAALMGIDMVKVPPDMDETRRGGAFWFEKDSAHWQGNDRGHWQGIRRPRDAE